MYKNLITVLKALEIGIKVKLPKLQEVVASKEGHICHEMIKYSVEEPKEQELILMNLYLPFHDLNDLANQLSDEEISLINANIVLNKIKGTRYDR